MQTQRLTHWRLASQWIQQMMKPAEYCEQSLTFSSMRMTLHLILSPTRSQSLLGWASELQSHYYLWDSEEAVQHMGRILWDHGRQRDSE